MPLSACSPASTAWTSMCGAKNIHVAFLLVNSVPGACALRTSREIWEKYNTGDV